MEFYLPLAVWALAANFVMLVHILEAIKKISKKLDDIFSEEEK